MNDYLEIIKIALAFFPFIALILTIPFILIEYHKFGSISFLKSFILYTFVFYIMCAYFLVILPLPDQSFVASLTTPRTQLIPFNFIIDFINHTSFDITNISTYLTAIKESYFYVPIYNLLLTLPFGIYIRYYFKTDLKKTIFYAFLLSLFFELTQLTGLYFIYPRGYRLFDVDDLLLNTFGGVLGYWLGALVVKILPEREQIELKSKIKGKNVSGLKRTTSIFLDFFIYIAFDIILSLFFPDNFKLLSVISITIYYVVLPFILKGSTLGEKYLNLRVVDNKEKNNLFKLFLRKLLFITIFIIVPIFLVVGAIALSAINIDQKIRIFVLITYIGSVIVIYFIAGIKYLFTNKKMLYEKISGTKMISTIK